MSKKKPNPIGICALCDKTRELQRSHIMPKYFYKRLTQNKDGLKAPLTYQGDRRFQSSKQEWKHLLCIGCEGIFKEYEDYTARITNNNLEVLKKNITRLPPPSDLAVLSENIDVDKIFRFGVSMIWRSSVTNAACKLGPYEASFKKYLFKETNTLEACAMHLGLLGWEVNTNNSVRPVTRPETYRENGQIKHGFHLFGISFMCYVGKNLKSQHTEFCLSPLNQKNYIQITSLPHDLIMVNKRIQAIEKKNK